MAFTWVALALGCSEGKVTGFTQPPVTTTVSYEDYVGYTDSYGYDKPYTDVVVDTGRTYVDGVTFWDTGRDSGAGYGYCPEPLTFGTCVPGGVALPDAFTVWTFPWGAGLGSDPVWWLTTYETQEAWDDLVATTLDGEDTGVGVAVGSPLPVDFALYRVAVVGYRQSRTCGLALAGVVTSVGPNVAIEVDDASAECCFACSNDEGVAVAVAIPRSSGGLVNGCVQVVGGCTDM